jgi:hypothetical protein
VTSGKEETAPGLAVSIIGVFEEGTVVGTSSEPIICVLGGSYAILKPASVQVDHSGRHDPKTVGSIKLKFGVSHNGEQKLMKSSIGYTTNGH